MKIRTEKEISLFLNTIRACEGAVTMVTPEGRTLNLKNELELHRAVGLLLGDNGNDMEIFVSTREDMGRLFDLLAALRNRETAQYRAA